MNPKGVPWSSLGAFGVPLGDFLGSLDVLLAAVVGLGGSYALERFPGFPGNSGRTFGPMLGSFIMLFLLFFRVCSFIDF